MRVLRRAVIQGLLRLADLCAILASVWFWTKVLLIADKEFALLLNEAANREVLLLTTLLLLAAWYWRLSVKHLYDSRALHLGKGELAALLAAFLQATLLSVAMLMVLAVRLWPVAVLFGVTASLSILLLRAIMYRLLAFSVKKGFHTRTLLVLGTNQMALDFALAMHGRVDLGYDLVGFADDHWREGKVTEHTGWTLVCNLDNLTDYLKTHVVDEVAIALPLKSFFARSLDIISFCEEQGISVRLVVSLGMAPNSHYRSEVMDEYVLITKQSGDIRGWGVLFKRIMDPLVAGAALIVLFPLFLLVAMVIKLDSPGPVFFRQQRVGQNKRFFQMFKFRTMVANAEQMIGELEDRNEMAGPTFKIRQDPRVTRVGQFLRRFSIDELPQFVNVLKGEMTLVGPRPLPMRDYHRFNNDRFRRRFSAKPGLTCLWQVNGRSDLPYEEWMNLDLWYIDHWSLWLDFQILLKTVFIVLRGKGAA